MKKILIFALGLFLLVSCGDDDDGGSDATVRIGEALQSSDIVGGVVIYGLDKGTGEKRTYLFQNATEIEGATLAFPNNSTWDFRLVTWQGAGGNFTGTIRCAYLPNVGFSSGPTTLDINLTNSNCFNNLLTISGGKPTLPSGNFEKFAPLKFMNCGSFEDAAGALIITSTTDADTYCRTNLIDHYKGVSDFFRLSIYAKGTNGLGLQRLSSGCISTSELQAGLLHLNLPVGYTEALGISFTLEAFMADGDPANSVGSGCASGNEVRTLEVPNGLAGGGIKGYGLYDVDTLPLYFNNTAGNEAIEFAFADTISGRGVSSLSHLSGSFTCSSGDCLPTTDPLQTFDYLVLKGSPTNIYLNNGASCIGILDTFSESGTWSTTLIPNPYPGSTLLGNCNFTIDTGGYSSFADGGAYADFTATVDGQPIPLKKIWVYEGEELFVRDELYQILGSSQLKAITIPYDGTPNNQMGPDEKSRTIRDGFLQDLQEVFGAQFIGGLLKTAFSEATNCSELPHDSFTFQYNFGEGLEPVQIRVEDGSTKVIPDFTCNDTGYNGSCGGAYFDKKISLILHGNLEEVYYLSCSRKVGMHLQVETDELPDYRKKLSLWNLKDANYARFEVYSEEQRGSKTYGRYTRGIKTTDLDFDIWNHHYEKDSGILKRAEQMVVAANDTNWKYRHRFYDDQGGASDFSNYSWASNGDDLFTVAYACVDSSLMTVGSCTNYTKNIRGEMDNDDNSVGTSYAVPYLGIESSIRLDLIKDGFPFPDINSF